MLLLVHAQDSHAPLWIAVPLFFVFGGLRAHLGLLQRGGDVELSGAVSPTLFAVLVIVAITTTLMTTPLLDWTYPPRLRRRLA